jgi:uncharacterized protein YraI
MNIIEKTYSLNGTLQKRAKTDMIILHHAVYDGDVEGIDRIHKGKGWTCIGYHFYVRKDGSIYRGRREDTVGAHAYGSNTDSIGICAEGNFENETMGDVQKQALKELVAYLKNKYGITKVQRHRDVNATACPGKNYPFEEIANATVKSTENKPIENKAEGYLVKVTANALNIRAGAGTNYNIVGCIRDKGTYTIIETQGDWGRLKSGSGWICLNYTTKNIDKSSDDGYVLGLYVVNTSAGLNVRKGAGTNYAKVKAYPNGTRFDTYEIKGNWAKTPSGWVCLDYCKLVNKY